ncbi:aminopeptidase Q-like [Huso huso]|uniref:Aminopeptidase n=1 Tax=Huso huso TaxID=61971 RepID=A0ABR1ABT1_HUSHU
MGPKCKSGFYVSKIAAVLVTVLFAALLISFTVLAALYAISRMGHGNATMHEEPTQVPIPFSSTFAATTQKPSRPGIWDHYRLPQTLVPINYQLELWPRLDPDYDGTYRFTGEANITFQCKGETDIILLHISHLNVTVSQLEIVSGGTEVPLVLDVWKAEVNPYMVLELNTTLKKDSVYVLRCVFTGAIGEKRHMYGLFIIHYTDEGQNMSVVASQMEPTYARSVFPCFDEPAMKATFDVRIVHLYNYVALSNMPAVDVTIREDENGHKWNVTTFSTTPKMSTYITAFVVCEFDYVSKFEGSNEIRVWARKSSIENGEADYALNVTGPILTHLEHFFNVSYPLSKTDLVALPDFIANAMENWGLMIYREDYLLHNQMKDSLDQRAVICTVIAHELGHQWFGNLVTMNWWNHLWLNEGLATFFEYLVPHYVEPQMKLNELHAFADMQEMFSTDSFLMSQPLTVKEEEIRSHQILPMFNLVTYNKGASIVRMAASFLTKKVFQKGLSSYLQNFSYMTVEQDNLWNHWQKSVDSQNELQLPAPVKDIMDSWTLQMGYPLITLNTSSGTITQEKCFLTKPDNQTSHGNWFVPINWIKNGSVQPMKWLEGNNSLFPEMQATSDQDWILLNVNVSGYYRVNYDHSNWERVQNQLMKDPNAIPVKNRAQIIDDAFKLVLSGYLDVETALSTTKYLSKETEFMVWSTALDIIDLHLNFLSNTHLYGLFKQYLLRIFSPLYKYYMDLIGGDVYKVKDDAFMQVSVHRSVKTACWLGLKECLQLAASLYGRWMSNSTENKIPSYVRYDIYCYGIASGGVKEWEFAWEMFQSQNGTEQDQYLLFALSCSREPWLLNRYLQYSLDSSLVQRRYTGSLLNYVIENDIGQSLAWGFIQENWKHFQTEHGGHQFTSVLGDLAERFSSEFQLDQLVKFITSTMDEHKQHGAIEHIEEMKKSRICFKTKYYSRIYNWLKENLRNTG